MRILIILFGIILSVFFLSCSNENDIVDQGMEETAKLISSPNGFKIASSEKDLQKLIGITEGIIPINVEIESVEFVDTDKVSVAYVNYINKATGGSSNIVITKGVFNYDTEHLQINKLI